MNQLQIFCSKIFSFNLFLMVKLILFLDFIQQFYNFCCCILDPSGFINLIFSSKDLMVDDIALTSIILYNF